MTIYTRKYPDFGDMTSVLILTYEDTGLLSGCLLDYAKDGRLTGIHPHERISAMELERSWTMMHADAKPTIMWSGGCEHMGNGLICGACMGLAPVG